MITLFLRCIFTSRLYILNTTCYGCTPNMASFGGFQTFGTSPPAADDPHLMLSNDPRLPPYVPQGMSGPWTELYPIKILNRSSFTEAALWLCFRDFDHANGLYIQWLDLLIAAKKHPEGITLRPRFQDVGRIYFARRTAYAKKMGPSARTYEGNEG